MKFQFGCSVLAVAATLAFTLGAAGPALAQQKAPGAKHQACLAKAQAENPNRTDGRQRQAAYQRCMRGG